MSEVKQIVTRPNQHVKIEINPVSSDVKLKIKTAFQEVINAIKDKHLS
jgi:hypothetical protein